MVFPYSIISYKFVNIMKHNSSQKFMLSFVSLVLVYLSLSFKTLIVTVPQECGTPFHGFIDYDIDCEEEVLITALPEDVHGTIVNTSITFKERLRITPGASSVKILPPPDTDVFDPNDSGKNRRLKLAGTSGNQARKDPEDEKPEPSEPAPLNYTITNQYIGIADATAPIIHYSMYSLDGMPVIEVNHKQPLNFQVPIHSLSSDIYILILQLENGDVHSKTFAKL